MENKLLNSAVTMFCHEEFGEIRVVNCDGDPWFVAKDVAAALGYIRTADAVREHCKGVGEIQTPSAGGAQVMKIIPEPDVYRLALRSKLPQAEAFQDWIVCEVLPSIRKHGVYMTSEAIEKALTDPDTLIRLASNLKEERRKRNAIEARVREDRPKVVFADAVDASKTSILIGDLAKLLRQNGVMVGQNRLFAWLRDNDYLMKRGESRNMPTQWAMEIYPG